MLQKDKKWLPISDSRQNLDFYTLSTGNWYFKGIWAIVIGGAKHILAPHSEDW